MDPTEEEKQVVEQLKKDFKEHSQYPFTDVAFLRFLRGFKGNKENALNGLMNTSLWRQESKIDELTIDCTFPYNKNNIASAANFYDRDGRPVFYCMAGRHNKMDRDLSNFGNTVSYLLEKGIKDSPKTEKITILFILSDLNMKCLDYDAVRLLVDILQQHYPEVLGRALIVNAPFIFTAFWEVIRRWLDPITVAKVRFIKPKELGDFIDCSNLSDEVRNICKLKSEGK